LTRQTAKKKRLQFRALHDGECFILPNPWDVGSVRMLVHLGFKALASISTGFALSTGRPDYALSRDEALRHLAALNEAADLPINADFESGFAEDAEGVAQSVKLAIEAGGAGLSIKDRDVSGPGLYGITESVDRIKAAGAAIDESGENVVLVARTEGLLLDAAALKPAIEKLVAFADARADCLYAPGARDHRDIAELVSAVAPKPLNVVMMRPGLSFAELTDLGVRRNSIGGALARVMWASVIAAAREISEGRFDVLASGTRGAALNDVFRAFADGGVKRFSKPTVGHSCRRRISRIPSWKVAATL
jgi:2-methylisocitrate lyase-like PEP mutase family enzyme